jgi:uncharacterized protein (TIGR02597 family)
MKKLNLALAILVTAVMAGNAQTTVNSDVVGYVSQTLTAGSDTIIAPQLLRPSEFSGNVTSVTVNGAKATLGFAVSGLTAGQLQYVAVTQPKTYVAIVTAGNLTGTYLTVDTNGTSDVTVNLDGILPTSADITAIEIRPCWTVNQLFPASDANASFTPSTGTTTATRRTQILVPNFAGTGINRAPSKILFYNPAVTDWVLTTATSAKAGDTAILPGQYVIHRNTGGTPVNLNLTSVGGVYAKPFANYLGTLSTGANDNPLAFPRATDYKLSELGFTDTDFVQSTGKTTATRKDTVLVYNTSGTGINRAPSKIYFKYAGAWYDTASTGTAVDVTIPAGSAVIVRKVTSDGNDKVALNTSNVSL